MYFCMYLLLEFLSVYERERDRVCVCVCVYTWEREKKKGGGGGKRKNAYKAFSLESYKIASGIAPGAICRFGR